MARPMTLEEILEAIRGAPRPSGRGEGHRVEELLEMTGLPRNHVQRAIKAGLAAGTIVHGTRWIETMGRRIVPVTSYVFLDATPPAKGKKK